MLKTICGSADCDSSGSSDWDDLLILAALEEEEEEHRRFWED